MSRLSVGSSSSSRLWPSSSRQRISRRAFWPPESVSVERFAASCEPVARERAHRRLERAEPLLHDVEHDAAVEVGARVELREQARPRRGCRAAARRRARSARRRAAGSGASCPSRSGPISPTRSPKWISSSNGRTRPSIATSREPTHDARRVAARHAAPGSAGRAPAPAAGRRRRSAASASRPRRPASRCTSLIAARCFISLVEVEQPPLLALPLLEPVAEQLLALLARLGIRAVRAAVHPRAAVLEREDRADRRAEQVAVVADQQRSVLRDSRDPPLELELRGHVEEVVGLVEQQHRRLAGQQHLEHEALALAARQLASSARGPTSSSPARTIRRQAASQRPSSS